MIRLKTLDEVVQSLINSIYDKLPSADTKEGTFVRDVFIDPVADEIDALNIDMKMLEYSQSILTATGEDLDRLATNYNVTRKDATISTGTIRFYIKNINMDFIIQPNTQLATQPTYSEEARVYQTTNTKIIYYIHDKTNPPIDITNNDILNIYLPIYQSNLKLGANGFYYYDVNTVSSVGGAFYNVGADMINVPVDNIDSNIQSFTNPIAFTGGSDKESDSNLVLRIKLALQGANIGTKYGYLSYVLKQDGVESAAVVAAMDNDMIRDITAYTYANQSLIHDGGKVDIYIKGQKTTQETMQIYLTDEVIGTDSRGLYTNLILDEEYKPITKMNSISWYTTDNNFGNYTNADDFGKEISYAIFKECIINNDTIIYTDDDMDMNVTLNMKRAISKILNDLPDIDIYSLGSPYRFTIDSENLIYTKVYGNIDSIPPQPTIIDVDNLLPYTYIYEMSEDTSIMAPFRMIYFINENNEIIFIRFTFVGAMNSGDRLIPIQLTDIALCHTNDAYNAATPKLNWHYYRNAKKGFNDLLAPALSANEQVLYYKDLFLTNDLLFPEVDQYGGRTVDNDISDLCDKYNVPVTMFYNYLSVSTIQNQLLYNIENFKTKLNNYEYNIDLGEANITETTIYNPINVYPNVDIQNDGYVYINIKCLNNTNINHITFNIQISNTTQYLDLYDINYKNGDEDYIPVTNGIIEENIYNSGSYFNWQYVDTTDNYCDMCAFKIKVNNDIAPNFIFTIVNAKAYDDRNNLLQTISDSVSVVSDDISSAPNISQIEDTDIVPVMYYLTQYEIGNKTYKYVVDVPINVDDDMRNVPITFIKNNNELYIRTYVTPDYQLVNMNDELYGNSKNAFYRLYWFNNPMEILDANIYLTLNFDINTLIQEIQEGIEDVKCLTADVLIKEAVEYPIEIVADICYDDTYDEDETYNNITNEIANYVNNNFPMGGTLKLAHLITKIQKLDGVSYIDSSTIKLRKLYGEESKSITIHQYEYFKLRNLVLNEIEE